MGPPAETVCALLERLEAGDDSALGDLFDLHRQRLRQELAGELAADPRLGARFDASDVVQEVYLEARREIGWYLANGRGVDFWFWLRSLARERRLRFLRDHLDAQCRTAKRQQALPDESAHHPATAGPSPSSAAGAAEQSERLALALLRLGDDDREVIRLRVTEGRTNPEVASLLGLTPAAVAKRLERALRRLRELANERAGGTEA
jgi:RNA polymerase sigma-70 factor (ECF subfamily)